MNLDKITNTTAKQVSLVLLSNLLHFFAWRVDGMTFVIFLCYIPLFLVIFNERNSINKRFLYYFLFNFLMFFWAHRNFLIDIEYRNSVIIGCIIFSILWSLPIFLSNRLNGLGKYTFDGRIAFLLFFIGVEFVQYSSPFEVPWMATGLSLANSNNLSFIYSYIGLTGCTIFIILINYLGYISISNFTDNRYWSIIYLAFIFTATTRVFLVSPERIWPDQNKILVISPTGDELRKAYNNYSEQLKILTQYLQGSSSTYDLVILPEGFLGEIESKYPLFAHDLNDHPVVQKLKMIAKTYNCAILSGATIVELYKANQYPTMSSKHKSGNIYYDIYNSSLFIAPDQKAQWRSKQKLVPITETGIFYKYINYLNNIGWISWRSEKTFGTKTNSQPYYFRNYKIAPLICFESFFPNIANRYVENGANLLVCLSTNWTSSEELIKHHQSSIISSVRTHNTHGVYCSSQGNSIFIK